MLSSLRSLGRGLKSFGPEYLLKAFSWRFPRRLFHYSHVYLVHSDQFTSNIANVAGFQFRLAMAADAPAFASVGVSSVVVERRLAAGDQCGIAVKPDGTIAAMVWAATGSLHLCESGVRLDIDSESIYRYNAFTVAAERQRGLYAGCCAALYRHFSAQQRVGVYGVISRFNLISQAASGSVGTRIAGESVLLTIFGVSFCRVRSWPHPVRKFRILFREPADVRII